MWKRVVNLNGTDWQFGSVPPRPWQEAGIYDLEEVREWLPATVPGNVRADLLALGRIPDPFYGLNNEESGWVDGRDWWYKKELHLTLEEGERAFLIFEGIDYLSAVFLNRVGEKHASPLLGRHEGMFSRQVYEITPLLQLPTSNLQPPSLIAVRIWGSAALPQLKLPFWTKLWIRLLEAIPGGPEPYPDRIATLKCQMSFGWDFAPRILTMGIWDDVYLVITRSVFISDVFFCQVPGTLKVPGTSRCSGWPVRARLELDSDRAQEVSVHLAVRGKNFATEEQHFSFPLSLEKGRQMREVEFTIENPKFWQPWDRGQPNLYEVEVQIPTLDSFGTTFGLREIEMHPNPEAPPAWGLSPRKAENWVFVLNGRREFIRGANWVPPDALPGRARREDYTSLLEMARQANINMLRVWGGGLREKKAFYDLCDEMGMLVWQEFPFACVFLGNYPRDEAFLNLAKRECSSIVRRLRNHPCIVLWCGGNEFNVRRNRALVETLRLVALEEDGTRPFRAASPGRGDIHNWRIWHGRANIRDYRKDEVPFVSEFGLQAAPDLDSLRNFLPQESLWPPGEHWRYHRAELEKLVRYARPWLEVNRTLMNAEKHSEICVHQRPILIAEFVSATQKAQAMGLQVAIEHFRRRKYKTGGVIFWQFNEPWPAISWSVVDWYRRPKLAYHRLEQLYNPILISLDYPLIRYRAGEIVRAKIWAINDLLESFEDCQLIIALDGEEVLSLSFALPADSAQPVGLFTCALKRDGGRLEAKLYHKGHLISKNEYDLGYYDPAEMGWRDALHIWFIERLIR
ncbi:MAG: glycosyl hydrolase 2 galactose-binding domain-containing protein [Anaerolineae bacterium]